MRAAPKEVATVEEQRKKEAEKHAQHQARRAAQEASLEESYARLEAQGCSITMLRLAQEAQAGTTTSNVCRRCGTIPQRLQRAYNELLPTGGVITVELLARAARGAERAAGDVLHWPRGT